MEKKLSYIMLLLMSAFTFANTYNIEHDKEVIRQIDAEIDIDFGDFFKNKR